MCGAKIIKEKEAVHLRMVGNMGGGWKESTLKKKIHERGECKYTHSCRGAQGEFKSTFAGFVDSTR